uniref:DUF1566 domain-containing protein n=1 Tax=Desulfatirhabdium butyrativorans TaxID=340467 RepID=A0A7C4VR74_9BACT
MKPIAFAKLAILAAVICIGLVCPALADMIDNQNGTVTDTDTGLTWEQESHGDLDWKAALNHCDTLSLAGHDDWRMPTIKELGTIADLSRSNPAINTYYFGDTAKAGYWSSTSRTEKPEEAWIIDFTYGDDGYSAKTAKRYVRAVRGGPPGQPVITPSTFYDNGDGTITDAATGLMWQKATQPAATWKDALAGCAGLNLGNHTDWRLPTIKELAGITSLTRSSPAINTYYFPDTVNGTYWSGTTRAEKSSEAWVIHFTYGDDSYAAKSTLMNVRAVRGGGPKHQPVTPTTFVDNGDGTVTDHITGLMWQQNDTPGLNWKSALAACVTSQTGGYTDWRMPTIKELASLTSLGRSGPAINTYYFPTTSSADYWSGTTRAETTSQAWVVNFNYGADNYLAKTSTAYVRAVRSGPAPGSCFLLGYLIDAVSGRPLAGVTVTVDGVYRDVTDASGIYYIAGLGCGVHTVTVIASGYAIYSRSVDTSQSPYLEIPLTRSNTVYGTNTPSGYSADPVNTATGNYIYHQKDFEIPGIGVAVVFERTYNSQDGTDSPLGFGWNHTYNPTLTVDNSGIVTIRWGDGRTETWVSDGAGGYTRQYGVFDDLIDNGDGTFTVKKKDNTRYLFNDAGRLASITDKNNNVITLMYENNLLTQIVDTVGRSIDFSYNLSDKITRITDPEGRTLMFDYDDTGNLISATNMNGHATTFSYDDMHQVLSVKDPRGNVVVTNTYDENKRVVTCQKDAKLGQTRYTYHDVDRKTIITDALGHNTVHRHDDLLRLVEETDPLGYTAVYSYDDMGNRVSVTDKNGHITQYTYDSNGNVLSKTDALGHRTTIEYNADNNPVKRTDAMGNVTAFQYDGKGNLVRTSDAIGNLNAYTYDARGLPLTLTDANGNVTVYQYDNHGNRILVRDAEGQETRYTYDAVGRMTTKTDPLGHKTSYSWDGVGNLLVETDPTGSTRKSVYDANNNRIQSIDELGRVTTFEYDVKNLLIRVTDARNGVQRFTYDALDHKLSETDPNGHTTQYAYDAAGNMVRKTDALGQITLMTYDAVGNQISETNPAGHTSTFGYDALNRMVSLTDPLGNTIHKQFDANDRMIAQTDAGGNETRYVYDIRDRLIQVLDAEGGAASYTYDGNGNRLSMTDPNGHMTRYRYDRVNRLMETTEALGGKTTYAYDAAGNRISLTDPTGNILVYAYDSRNRMTQITRGARDVVTFRYAANNLRTGMTDPLGNTQYDYDELGRLISFTDPFGKTVQYVYDASGNQTAMIYPDGKTVTYGYDSLNRLVSMTDWMGRQTVYAYSLAGDLVHTTLPNGMVTTSVYDAGRRLTGMTSKKPNGTPIVHYAFTLDETGNHVSELRTEPLESTFPAQEILYTQDAENRLLSAGTTAFGHDNNGNMISANGRTFVYDVEDRLIESASNGKTLRYGYDGVGNRFVRTISGQTVRYVLDVSRKLPSVIAETTETGEITAYYVYGYGLTAKVMPNGAAFYYHFDVRGSTVAMTDVNQNVTSAFVYGPFGEKLNQTGDPTNPFTYMGRYGVMDDGDGLYYVRARYYWPQIGRFLNKDRLVGDVMQTQSLHRYVYAMNNPVLLVDPNGELANWVIGAGIGAAWGFGGTLVGDIVKSAATGQWELSSWETYFGATVGGAVTGALYATPGGAVYASAAGSIIEGFVTQGLQMRPGGEERRFGDFDYTEIAVNTAIDVAFGAATGFVKIQGKPSGRPATNLTTKFIKSKYKNYYLKKEIAEMIVDKAIRKGLFGATKTSKLADEPYIPEAFEARPYDFVIYKK